MLTEQVAAGLDAADIRILEVPHPLGGTDEATIRQWADAAVDDTLALFGADVEATAAPTNSVQPEGIDAAVGVVRDLVAADGGDIELIEFDGSIVRLRLVLDTVECRECVMPADFLQTVAFDKMQAHIPGLASVRIEDPRE